MEEVVGQIGPETTLKRAERAVHGELPEETVLLDVEDGVAVRLNPSGAFLWGELEQPATVRDLARGLAERFEIGEERALGDTVAFAREMVRRALLEAD
jgi:Coenzyme PQQ synthesis protein D (PqqD)